MSYLEQHVERSQMLYPEMSESRAIVHFVVSGH